MTWIALVRGLLTVAGGLIKFLSDRELISAGEAKQAAGALKKANAHVAKGKAAMDRINSDPEYRRRVQERFTRR